LAIKGRFGKAFGLWLGRRRTEFRVDSSLTSFFAEAGSSAEASQSKSEAAPRWESVDAGIAEGRALLEKGDVGGAVAFWEQTGDAFPDSVAAFQQPGSLLVQARRFAQAKSVLGRGLERFPGDRQMMVDWGWALHQLQDFPNALNAWRALREVHPRELMGFLGGAASLRQLKRLDEAEALLREARERWPENRQVLVDLGYLGIAKGDFTAALPIWSEVRARFPKNVDGYLWGALALRELGQLQAAEELARAGLVLHPTHSLLLLDFARIAQSRGDWEEALRRWEAAGRVTPAAIEPQSGRAGVLRTLRRFDEADALLSELSERFPDRPELLIDLALVKHDRGDFDGAASVWQRAIEASPDERMFHLAGSALMRSQRLADAKEVLRRGLERFPGSKPLMIDWCSTLHLLREWPEALKAWGALSRANPTEWVAILGGAATLRQMKRFDDAEALLLEGREQLGEHPVCEIDLAWVASERKDWVVASARWEAVREKSFDEVMGYLGGAVALRESGRFDEAEALLREALVRFTEHRQVLMDLAHLKLRRQDFAGAAEIWDTFRARYPDAEGYIWGAFALRRMGRLGASEDLVRAGLELHPTNPLLLRDFAKLAQWRGDWVEALRRWEAAGRVMPGAIEPQIGRAGALRSLRRFDEAEALLAEICGRFPDRLESLTELGMMKQHRQDFTGAVGIWEQVRRRFPQNMNGYIWGAFALRELRQFEAAEELVRAGLELQPTHPQLLADFATVAQARGDWNEALRRWEAARAAAPDVVEFQIGRLGALKALRRFGEALSSLRELAERFPDGHKPIAGLAVR
jgi:tetratricopeptide (TPR) repeat protein